MSKLPRLETNLTQTLNVNMNSDKTDGGYSFLFLNDEWDTVNRGGPWSSADLTSIEYIRSEMDDSPNIHSFTLRYS